jgi:membrane protein required for colicin V production
MSGVDWTIAAIVGVSVLLGLVRGVTRELISLAGWIAGCVLAYLYARAVGAMLPFELPIEGMNTALAAVLILLACLITAALAGALLRALLAVVKLSFADRVLGAAFGLLRALLIVGGLVLLGAATEAPKLDWWKASRLLPWVQACVRFASPVLPESLARLAKGA